MKHATFSQIKHSRKCVKNKYFGATETNFQTPPTPSHVLHLEPCNFSICIKRPKTRKSQSKLNFMGIAHDTRILVFIRARYSVIKQSSTTTEAVKLSNDLKHSGEMFNHIEKVCSAHFHFSTFYCAGFKG